jgi:hypothetical protein
LAKGQCRSQNSSWSVLWLELLRRMWAELAARCMPQNHWLLELECDGQCPCWYWKSIQSKWESTLPGVRLE